ncbi:hypothetical protein NKH53_31595, partial [Mesorhizobium australicum]
MLVALWNYTVRPNDEVWHLGDTAQGPVETVSWPASVHHHMELAAEGTLLRTPLITATAPTLKSLPSIKPAHISTSPS